MLDDPAVTGRVLLKSTPRLLKREQVTRLGRAVTVNVQRLSELPLHRPEPEVRAAD